MTLQKLECDICSEDIDKHYDLSAEIVNINQQLLRLASADRQGSKYLSAGRVVVLRDNVRHSSFRLSYLLRGAIQHFRWAAALVLKPAPTHEQVKCFFVLSLVDSETKSGKNGTPHRNGPSEK